MPSPNLTSEYEPVKPLGGATPSAAGLWDDERDVVRSLRGDDGDDFDGGGGSLPPTANSEESAEQRTGQKREKKPWLERWGTRRGHLAGFAGLFLFTFILYFRPY